jgi:hypothetical protein
MSVAVVVVVAVVAVVEITVALSLLDMPLLQDNV